MLPPEEVPLTGGNASGPVVRTGATVRKPWLPVSDRVAAYLRALRAAGIDVPEHHGRDEQGRQVLEFVPGDLAIERAPLDDATVRAVGALIRSIHDASEAVPVPDDWPVLIPAEEPDLICHNDLASWNLVVDGERLVFIDWDGAGPSTRLWDLAYAAISFAHLFPGSDLDECGARLHALLDGYRADAALRAELPGALSRRARAMDDLLHDASRSGHQPWAAMYAEGHGTLWRTTAEFIATREDVWARACAGGVPD